MLSSALAYCYAHAGTTGKIAGRVIDAETREPLVGVTVMLEGTTLGAATDADGMFVINNIPPGVYTVNVSAVGYQKKQFKNITVSVDFTTKLNVELKQEAVSIAPVVVEAQAPLIRQDLTSSHTTVDATQIRALPVESVTQILITQAGIIQGAGGELHIRGGRSNEIAYTVNGVSIANPFNNSASITIATNAIQELSVVSGTFNAEYGNALSGVVNTVTKEGGESYHGQLTFYTGDHLSTRKDIFFNIDKINPVNHYVSELTLGGPVPFTDKMLSFFVSGRLDDDKGWLYGVREHQPSDFSDFNDPRNWKVQLTGDGKIVPMNPGRDISATGKLTLRPIATIKVNYDVLFSSSDYKVYSHDFKYNPDGRPEYHDTGLLNSLDWTHTLSDKTFYTVKASYNTTRFKQYLYEDSLDSRYQPVEKLSRPGSTFYFGGTSNYHYYQDAQTISGKFDITSQLSHEHEIKAGVEARFHTLNMEGFTVLRDTLTYLQPTIPSLNSPDHNKYTHKPVQFAAYIQDKMEYESIILNVGLRYDYFNARAKYPTNVFYPDPNDSLIPPSIDRNTLLADAAPKHQISPRIGISYPITDRGIIHFSYGHFFQMPSFANLYTNSEFESALFIGEPVFGNANLEPEKTITYEFGLQQQLTDNLAFTLTGFYKDVRDLLALEVTRISGERVYQRFVNKDYGNIKGITFSLTKRRTGNDLLALTVDYTFQIAEGNNNNADAFFIDLLSGRQSERTIIFLDWDQTHTLNTTVALGKQGDWNVSFIGRLGTGLPYTPFVTSNLIGLRPNSARKPSQLTVDLLAEKQFQLGGLHYRVFLKVFNLFDNLNERYVYEDTGTATYTIANKRGAGATVDQYVGRVPGVHSSDDYFNRPNYYAPPREVMVGISVGF